MSATAENLYERLGVATDADTAAIAKAYRRLAIQYHPDRNPDGAETFKALTQAYEVLGDAERRQMYDVTGSIGEGDGIPQAGKPRSAAEELDFFDEMARETKAFADAMRGSEEEKEFCADILRRMKGSYTATVEECIFQNEPGEVERITAVIDALVATPKMTEWAAKWKATRSDAAVAKLAKRMAREAKEATETLKAKEEALRGGADKSKKGSGAAKGGELTSMQSLQNAIRARAAGNFADMIGNLEKKYGGAGKKSAGPKKGTARK